MFRHYRVIEIKKNKKMYRVIQKKGSIYWQVKASVNVNKIKR